MEKTDREKWFVTSLDRGIRVIRAFSEDSPVMKVSEVAARAGISRAAARRFLLTLSDLGYIGADGDRWFLRPHVLNIGYALLSSMHLDDIVQPVIDAVAAKTGETSSVAVRDGAEIVFLARTHAKRFLNVHVSIGSRMPAYATSLGKVLLAALPDDEVEKLFGKPKLPAYADNTITTVAALKKELHKVRTQGYATTTSELEFARASVAVPIHDSRGRTVAAINISTDTRRLKEPGTIPKFVDILREGAERISASIRTSRDSVLVLSASE